MGLRERVTSKYREDGLLSLIKSAPPYVYRESKSKGKSGALGVPRKAGVWASSRNLLGRNVFEEDWDLLILLDTCRPDALRAVEDEYPFINSVEKRRSVGGQSPEWIANTFDRSYADVISNTAYITANPHSGTVFENNLESRWDNTDDTIDNIERMRKWGKYDFVSKEDLGKYDPLWKYESKDDYEHPPPRYVTDRAIETARESDFSRIILHYMPPHAPYVSRAREEERELKEHESNPFGYLRNTGDKETVYNAYLHMLRWVLDDVELLLNNIDSEKVVISSDHGEAFGEYGVYNHHSGSLHPHIRNVPWSVTTATDRHEYEPQFNPEETSERSVEDTLEALGYL